MTPPPSCTNSLGDSRWSSTSPDTSPRCRYTCWTWFPPNISNPLKWEKNKEKTNISTVLTDPISSHKEEIEAQQPAKVTWRKLNIPLACVASGSAGWEGCTFTVTFPVLLTEGNCFQAKCWGQAHVNIVHVTFTLWTCLKSLIHQVLWSVRSELLIH